MRALLPHRRFALVAQWSRTSQDGARRNAMAASTECAARRLERVDAAAFIAAFLAAREDGVAGDVDADADGEARQVG